MRRDDDDDDGYVVAMTATTKLTTSRSGRCPINGSPPPVTGTVLPVSAYSSDNTGHEAPYMDHHHSTNHNNHHNRRRRRLVVAVAALPFTMRVVRNVWRSFARQHCSIMGRHAAAAVTTTATRQSAAGAPLPLSSFSLMMMKIAVEVAHPCRGLTIASTDRAPPVLSQFFIIHPCFGGNKHTTGEEKVL
jgi:hypothetical protein